MLFELGAKEAFPDLKADTQLRGSQAGRVYRSSIDVLHYEPRNVRILFSRRTPTVAQITVDGPTESPHRYQDGNLCIWYPNDPEETRWVIDDGLLHLMRLVEVHLFRESWWRETGVWCGPEAGHTEGTELAKDIAAAV